MKNLLFKGIGNNETNPSSPVTLGTRERELVEFIDEAANRLIRDIETIEKDLACGSTNPPDTLTSLETAMDTFVEKAALYEANIDDRDFLRSTRTAFHQKTNHIFSRSYCFNRTRTWPQGYHGDYKTLETVYRNIPLSDGIGYYLDLYALHTTLARGVRNRMKMLQSMLKDELTSRHSPAVMSIACGSCRELVEISPEISHSGAHITAIDNDEDALHYAQSRLYYTGIQSSVEFRKYNALRLFDHDIAEQDFGQQDIIYSVGLFDYLETDFLVKMIDSLYRLLSDGGKMILAFKDARKYRSQVYHWFMDWYGFLQRYEEDFRDILSAARIPESAIEESRDSTGAIIFYTISR